MFAKLCSLKNKKGFTLIEMLVVIAIIAVLVAIIIPVVSNSTLKAAAATNAANLRSYQAELSVAYLTPSDTVKVTAAADGNLTIEGITAPTSKKVGTLIDAGVAAKAKLDTTTGQIVVDFGTGKTIDYFAYIAENGKAKE